MKHAFLILLFALTCRHGFSQKTSNDSCDIKINSWFEPACNVDTCMYTHWFVDYTKHCNITRVLYKVYDPKKTKLIYQSNKVWEGKTDTPFGFYKADYYPYEITFYKADKTSIVKKGKVYLHVW